MTIDYQGLSLLSSAERSTMVLERIGAPLPPTGGSCSSLETEWWFPKHAQKKEDLENTKRAVAICRECPIRKDCLEYAIIWEAYGIWGGFTEKQRDAIRNASGSNAKIALRRQSRADKEIGMLIEHKELVWLKKKGFINATS